MCVCVEHTQGECANTEAHPKTAAQARTDNPAAPSTNGGEGGGAESDAVRVEDGGRYRYVDNGAGVKNCEEEDTCQDEEEDTCQDGGRDRNVDDGGGVKNCDPAGWWAGKKMPTARKVILSFISPASLPFSRLSLPPSRLSSSLQPPLSRVKEVC